MWTIHLANALKRGNMRPWGKVCYFCFCCILAGAQTDSKQNCAVFAFVCLLFVFFLVLLLFRLLPFFLFDFRMLRPPLATDESHRMGHMRISMQPINETLPFVRTSQMPRDQSTESTHAWLAKNKFTRQGSARKHMHACTQYGNQRHEQTRNSACWYDDPGKKGLPTQNNTDNACWRDRWCIAEQIDCSAWDHCAYTWRCV